MDKVRDSIEDILIDYKSKIIGMDYERFDEIVDKRKYEQRLDNEALTALHNLVLGCVPEKVRGKETCLKFSYNQAITEITANINELFGEEEGK